MRWRRTAATVIAAAAVVACVLGAGVLLLQIGLRTPSPARQTALRASVWLRRYRLVDSVFRIGSDPPTSGRCLQTWLVRDGRRRRATVLRLDDGFALDAVVPHTLESSGGSAAERALSPLILLELGGCPRILGQRLSTLAQRLEGVTVTSAAHRSALHFAFKGTRLVVYVDRSTGRPLALDVAARDLRASSRVRFVPLTPALAKAILG